ncbi:acetoacetyl-CoA reductase [Dyella silvatica]|uniref:acetoacetyl-CoA reductase n=1 Tax=Dyella silvatica TaxID=2992128 RepID=UPI00225B3E5D|nr:acetoacetyl-CoA reductase [Dyella silvatica]
MNERVAFITGGMGGLGEAISIKLHDAGYTVAVAYSPSNAGASDWLAAMKVHGRTFAAYGVDVTDYESCQDCISRVRQDLGSIDILVNNAGMTRDAALGKMHKADWDVVLSTNLDSVFHMTKPVCDGMVARHWGRIINISSVNGSKGAFGQANYAAAKAGMHGFTKALALEVAKKGVTVNTVSPGYLETKMVAAIPHDILTTKILPQIPVGRLGRPDEVAGLIAYLCRDEAAFITGANVAINGGQHMQ